jgi:oxygen-independent coproporphyrinogen-3 oxidase
VPWLKKHQQLLPQEAMPDTSERLSILKQLIERLTDAGYVYIGMDHFAKPDDDLTRALEQKSLNRNFMGYSTYADAEVYAMGVTSISQLHNVYAQNVKVNKAYEQRLDEGVMPALIGLELNDDDKLRRYVITEIMCNSRVLKTDVQQRFKIDFDTYFQDALSQLEPLNEDGLVSVLPDRIQVHDAGRLVVRNIAMAFDAYLQADQQSKALRYSRTV